MPPASLIKVIPKVCNFKGPERLLSSLSSPPFHIFCLGPSSVMMTEPLISLGVQVGLAWVVLLRFPKSGPCQPLWTIHFKQPGHSSTALWELLVETEISLFTGPYLTSVKCYRFQNTRCSEKGSHKTINSCNLIFTLSANIANGNSSWNNVFVEELFKSMIAFQSPMQTGTLGHRRAI